MNTKGKTVLIVDDESFIRQSLTDYFEDYLWQTLQAGSSEEALELMDHYSPDCAIVDIRMEGMDGNAFIRNAHRKNENMVFIICTGSPEYTIPQDIRELACVSNKLFKKPVNDISELEKELLRMMERGHE